MYPINKYSSQDILKWKTTNVVCLYIKIENNVLLYKRINNNFGDRCNVMVKMIKDILNIYKIDNLEIFINLMDKPINNPYFLQFSRTTNCPINTIPNFSFYEWKDTKLSNFYNIKDGILNNKIDWDNKINKIMWSGSNSHIIRTRMNNLKTNDMYLYNLSDKTKVFYELKDHTKYKYLLDLEGVGYSGRFPYLALTGSCVILLENSDHDRDYKLYYDEHFIEDKHYLKIRYDSTDEISIIHEKILNKISINNCKKIGEDCQQVAIDLFTKDNILNYFSKVLNYYASQYEKSSKEYNKDQIYNFLYMNKRIKKIIMGNHRS
jgi:hypothetical protein